MGIWALILIAVGLSMDAFAVAICKGLNMPRLNYRRAALIAICFGGFQALMPVLGWLLGKQFEAYITRFDHWIAFGLLVFIGGKMIYDSLKKGDDCEACPDTFSIKELLMLAVATSIDALAVGVTFAFLKVNIALAACLIGAITFALSLLGCFIGHKFGAIYKRKAEFAGGAILVLIGVKILLEHLEIISF